MRSRASRMRDDGVRAVALRGDALVPVVVRVRRVLRLHRLQPRVLARRLIEMAVDADEADAHRGENIN